MLVVLAVIEIDSCGSTMLRDVEASCRLFTLSTLNCGAAVTRFALAVTFSTMPEMLMEMVLFGPVVLIEPKLKEPVSRKPSLFVSTNKSCQVAGRLEFAESTLGSMCTASVPCSQPRIP